jgi:hypothetical protein
LGTKYKELISEENFVRDWLKHRKECGDLEINLKEEAYLMIERAVSAYAAVTGSVTEIIGKRSSSAVVNSAMLAPTTRARLVLEFAMCQPR